MTAPAQDRLFEVADLATAQPRTGSFAQVPVALFEALRDSAIGCHQAHTLCAIALYANGTTRRCTVRQGAVGSARQANRIRAHRDVHRLAEAGLIRMGEYRHRHSYSYYEVAWPEGTRFVEVPAEAVNRLPPDLLVVYCAVLYFARGSSCTQSARQIGELLGLSTQHVRGQLRRLADPEAPEGGIQWLHSSPRKGYESVLTPLVAVSRVGGKPRVAIRSPQALHPYATTPRPNGTQAASEEHAPRDSNARQTDSCNNSCNNNTPPTPHGPHAEGYTPPPQHDTPQTPAPPAQSLSREGKGDSQNTSDENTAFAAELVEEVVRGRGDWYAPQSPTSRSRREMVTATAEALTDGWGPADITEAWNCCQFPTSTALLYVLRRLANNDDPRLRHVPDDDRPDRTGHHPGPTPRNAPPEPADPAAYDVEHLAGDMWRVRPTSGRPPTRLVHLDAERRCNCTEHLPGCINRLVDLGDCDCSHSCVHVEAVQRHGRQHE